MESNESYEEITTTFPFHDGVLLGIDLGTSTSCVAVWHLDKNRVKVIKSKCGEKTMPSTVKLPVGSLDKAMVGKEATTSSSPSNLTAITCTKRIIGMNWASEAFEKMKPTLPFDTVKVEENEIGIQYGPGQYVSPVEVAALIMTELKEVAVEWLSRSGHRHFDAMKQLVRDDKGRVKIKGCVVGVPVYFNDQQRVATKQAAIQAGFEEVTVLPESTAAALAYGLFIAGQKTVLVFDAGGGTTDVTLMSIDEGSFVTKSCGGDNMLGGEDMDTLVAKYLLNSLVEPEASVSDLVRDLEIRRACAEGRERLSSCDSTNITLLKKHVTLSREQLEIILEPFVERARKLVEKVCREGEGLEVDEVVLVGGVSRTPALRRMLKQLFPHLPDLCSSCDPTTTVAEGLAIKGAVNGGVSGKVLQSFLMSDVLPLPIGVEAFNSDMDSEGRMDVVLPRLSKLPAHSTRVFRCGQLSQKGITVDVYEGEQEMARANDKVASFSFFLPTIDENRLDKRTQYRDVLISFSMDEAGELRVVLEDDDYSEEASEGTQEHTSNNEWFLQVAIAILAVIYLAFRLFVRPKFEQYDFMRKQLDATANALAQEVDSSNEL